MSGEPDRAQRVAQHGLDLAPDSLPCMWTMGGALLEDGSPAAALDWLGRALERSGRMPYMVALHAHAAALAGDSAVAKAAIAELSGRPDGPRPGLVAWVHVGLGELDEAIPLFAEAIREHDPHALEPLVMPLCGRPARKHAGYISALDAAGLGALHRARAKTLD